MSRDSWQAVRAVFLAAIMVTSVFAAGIAFSGSAAAEVSSISGASAENVTAGSGIQTQDVTIERVNRTNSNLSNIEVELSADNTSINGASVTDAGSFGDANVSVNRTSGSNFSVEIDGNQAVTDNITVEVELDTSNADPEGFPAYTINPGTGDSTSV